MPKKKRAYVQPWNKDRRFIPEDERKISFGVTIPRAMVRRINALCGGMKGYRSDLTRELLELGLERKYGVDWAFKADEYAKAHGLGPAGLIDDHPDNLKFIKFSQRDNTLKPV